MEGQESIRGQAFDSAILNQVSITRELHGHVGNEFKLRPFSAGSILTLRKGTEPLAFESTIGALRQHKRTHQPSGRE